MISITVISPLIDSVDGGGCIDVTDGSDGCDGVTVGGDGCGVVTDGGDGLL